MDTALERLSIKNLLFSRAIATFEPTVPQNHKIYPCTDCGDKFLLQSSHEDHINRKSVVITYMCRNCNVTKNFYNRCRLLHHIRSHSFKTATINVDDLSVDPIPLGLYKKPQSLPNQPPQPNQSTQIVPTPIDRHAKPPTTCFECKKVLPQMGIAYKDRAAHFTQYSKEKYTCPVCLFTLPTMCAIRAHLRFHMKIPPYYCPECGVNVVNKNVHYPFGHSCEGFNMMRATARLKCPVEQCHLLHPNEFNDHMKDNHIKKVFKCPVCVVACFNEPTMQNHLNSHALVHLSPRALIFYQCELCPGRLVLQNHIDNHLRTHLNTNVFTCWTCGMVFKEVLLLLDHVQAHENTTEGIKKVLYSFMNENEHVCKKTKRVYRVVKRCDQCKRNFTYKCKYNEIPVLPNECPYKCTSKLKTNTSDCQDSQIKCHICNDRVPYSWKDIQKHYATAHKSYRCLEPKLVIDRMDVKKYMSRYQKKIAKRAERKKKRHTVKPPTPTNEKSTAETPVPISANQCAMCGHICENKEMLETHTKTHRDLCMAYQCLECGQSFVVKPSFSKHLMLAHGIHDVEEYITSKECYNENALDKHQKSDLPLTPPKENQCSICMDQFENAEDLQKHFRVHGMAFLLKNTSNNKEHNTSPKVPGKDDTSLSPTQ